MRVKVQFNDEIINQQSPAMQAGVANVSINQWIDPEVMLEENQQQCRVHSPPS